MNSATADWPLWRAATWFRKHSTSCNRSALDAGRVFLRTPPVACKSELTARRTAERLAQSRVGVIAWSRTGDAELGDFDEEPVVFFRAGRIPAELDE